MLAFNGQYQLSDLRAAQKLHAQRNLLSRLIGYFLVGGAVFVLLLGAIMALLGRGHWSVAIYPAIFLGVWVIFRFVLLPRQVARLFAQRKDYSAPFVVELKDDSFEFRNDYGSSRVPWKEFIKWIEDKELVLLYRSDHAYHMLPKRIFGEQGGVEYVRERLREHKVPLASQLQNSLQLTMVLILAIIVIVIFVIQIA